ncbi:hypothetical protein, partial [Xanthomonas arboricola]|uniref:hypothetical protein n=1 Tax=Xanthomonas arboricola TaxID=56448 RepID=UPI001C6146EA
GYIYERTLRGASLQPGPKLPCDDEWLARTSPQSASPENLKAFIKQPSIKSLEMRHALWHLTADLRLTAHKEDGRGRHSNEQFPR